MIEVHGLTKRFGPATAVDDVSFRVERGEIVGFLGPNGAGKSTTMRMLTGFIPASSGEARVGGVAVSEEPKAVRARIGYLPENNPLYEDLRVSEYLHFRAALKGIPRKRRAERVKAVVEACEAGEVFGRIIGVCSKGFRQRVGLADALLADPPVLILDEPTVGLDPQQIVHTRALIKELAKNHTVILSTHILSEVEAICSRSLIIHKGRLRFDGSLGDLRASLKGGSAIRCEIVGDPQASNACLASVPGVTSVEELSRSEGSATYSVAAEGDRDVRTALFWACAKASLPILELSKSRASLEDAFLSLTAEQGEDAVVQPEGPGPGEINQ